MAVKANNTARKTNTNTGNNGGVGYEKAAAFLNIALPTASGDTVRVDSIKLKSSNVVHQQLIDKLSDPSLTAEQRADKLAALKDLLIIDFQIVRSDEEKEIAAF